MQLIMTMPETHRWIRRDGTVVWLAQHKLEKLREGRATRKVAAQAIVSVLCHDTWHTRNVREDMCLYELGSGMAKANKPMMIDD